MFSARVNCFDYYELIGHIDLHAYSLHARLICITFGIRYEQTRAGGKGRAGGWVVGWVMVGGCIYWTVAKYGDDYSDGDGSYNNDVMAIIALVLVEMMMMMIMMIIIAI